METKNMINALAALAQEWRLAIFRLLVETGPEGLPVGQIAEKLGLANATLSFHLKELSNAGLLVAAPNGRSIIYSANFNTMNEVIGYLSENCCAGARCSTVVNCKQAANRKTKSVAVAAKSKRRAA
jgi:ArsR family transcriptional regulator, arsenate/arsenite/antimonite-responsive transcriptional repressor